MENQESPLSAAQDLSVSLGLRRWHAWKWWLLRSLTRLRRKLPYLVWYGQEIDCRVTLQSATLGSGSDMDLERIFAAEDALRKLGIHFDGGMGFHGRDWEWDFSLEGPISVVFVSRARNPERRLARPKPKLVVNNDAA